MDAPDPEAVQRHLLQCQPFDQQLADLDQQQRNLLAQRRTTSKRIALKDLPPEKRPRFIAPARTQLLNTIRITAYRAETALALGLRQHLARQDDARALLQDLFTHEADLVVDTQAKTLTVRVHHFTNPQASRTVAALLDGLNQTETEYPGTELVLR